jgi:ATP-binding cassette subfamily F protein uup
LDNVVTSTIAYEGTSDKPGFWREYEGGVTDWLIQSKRAAQIATDSSKAPTSSNTPKNRIPSNKNTDQPLSKKKLSYKEQRELDVLPAFIQQLEAQQKAIEQELFDSSLYVSDAKRASELTARSSKIEEELMTALQRWEALSA